MKFRDMKPGMVLYDRHTYRMGNTTLRALGEWTVVLVEMTDTGAKVRWNGNPPQYWPAHKLEKLKTWSQRDECAEVVRGAWDSVKKVTLKKGTRPPPPRIITQPTPPTPEARDE